MEDIYEIILFIYWPFIVFYIGRNHIIKIFIEQLLIIIKW